MLNNRKDQMIGAIIPILLYLLTEVQFTGFNVHIRMVYLTDKINLWGFFGELIEKHFEFEFGIFVQSEPNKHNTMPD